MRGFYDKFNIIFSYTEYNLMYIKKKMECNIFYFEDVRPGSIKRSKRWIETTSAHVFVVGWKIIIIYFVNSSKIVKVDAMGSVTSLLFSFVLYLQWKSIG
jgi:hypothetical protein